MKLNFSIRRICASTRDSSLFQKMDNPCLGKQPEYYSYFQTKYTFLIVCVIEK